MRFRFAFVALALVSFGTACSEDDAVTEPFAVPDFTVLGRISEQQEAGSRVQLGREREIRGFQ